jgi:hypothetical protein
MDLFIHGELNYRGNTCGDQIQPQSMKMIDNTELSQVVISSSAASCFINQYAKSDLAKINVNEERWN